MLLNDEVLTRSSNGQRLLQMFSAEEAFVDDEVGETNGIVHMQVVACLRQNEIVVSLCSVLSAFLQDELW